MRDDSNEQRERGERRGRSPAAIAVSIVWAAVALLVVSAIVYRTTTSYRRLVMKRLTGNIRYVELDSPGGAPPVRLTNPKDITGIRSVLADAERDPPEGATVYRAEFGGRVVYGDGRTEPFVIGGMVMPPGDGTAAVDGAVEIQWGGYTRYADHRRLVELLPPTDSTVPASTVPASAINPESPKTAPAKAGG